MKPELKNARMYKGLNGNALRLGSDKCSKSNLQVGLLNFVAHVGAIVIVILQLITDQYRGFVTT